MLADPREAGRRAAAQGAAWMREALAERGEANIIVATGGSQMDLVDALLREPDLAWNRVNIFHLDEYVGLDIRHPASFRQFLWSRLVRHLPLPPRSVCYISGEGDVRAECARVGALIARHPIDVCFAGIGENGHLAFNDPPADFEVEDPYIVVDLDEACRRQQIGEGWFPTFDDVPKQAISMSVRQVMKSRHIIITCPDRRKAQAVKTCLRGPVTPMAPASILQRHASCPVFLDPASASLLTG